MLDVFHIPTPQGCNIQTFYGTGVPSSTTTIASWNKPRGVSNIYILLIGGGGNGDGTTGGGSGAVTVWYGSAQNVPDQLEILAGFTPFATRINKRFTSDTPITLLSASPGSSSSAGGAMTANQFAASGFFQSVAGQNGSSTAISASSTTFLSGGANGVVTANYGYLVPISGDGIFQMQPIIVGAGGSGTQKGGIGCGGGSNGVGGPGMVLIASW